MAESLAATLYMHPVFPWEGPNGQGEWVTFAILIVIALLVCGSVAFLLFKMSRQ